MRAVIQRVSSAEVSVAGTVSGRIGPGLLVLLGVGQGDTDDDGAWLARKVAVVRIFPDEAGAMNRSVVDVDGGLLVVSQFTLFGSLRKGTRPSFNDAAPPDEARRLYEGFVGLLAATAGRPVATGVFGAMMQVSLVNDGPVTLLLDTRARD
jgi:D-aminoacyl-tRNA deacylase